MTNFEKKFQADALDSSAIVIDGKCYRIAPEHAGGFRGFGGRKFKIKFLATGKIVETTNLWHQGEIPAELNVSNNAEFV